MMSSCANISKFLKDARVERKSSQERKYFIKSFVSKPETETIEGPDNDTIKVRISQKGHDQFSQNYFISVLV